MIWRIRERSVFARLSQDGLRTRAGVLWCTHLPDPSASPPRVAFAIGRAVGPAVVRNRVRRRVRAVLTSSEAASSLPPGFYLIGARPAVAARSFQQLSSDVEAMVASVQRARSAPPTPPPTPPPTSPPPTSPTPTSPTRPDGPAS